MSRCLGVILVDFDGTIVEHNFPKIGKTMPLAFEVMKELQAAGWKLVLWTCREDDSRTKTYLTEAVEFCRANGVEFSGVNEALIEEDFRPEGCLMRKPHATYVVDDRNLGGFPGWDVVRKVILEKQPFEWSVVK